MPAGKFSFSVCFALEPSVLLKCIKYRATRT